MDFVCPTCERKISREMMVILSHTEEHIIDVIKKEHPDWIEQNSLCSKRYTYYKNQFRSWKDKTESNG